MQTRGNARRWPLKSGSRTGKISACQAVTSYILYASSTTTGKARGRSTGLSPALARAALRHNFGERDTDGATDVAEQYVEEVTRAWTNLKDGINRTH